MSNVTHYKVRGLEDAFIFSQAVRAGDTLYLSGHLSWDADGNTVAPGDMAGQVENIYREMSETDVVLDQTEAGILRARPVDVAIPKQLEVDDEERAFMKIAEKS